MRISNRPDAPRPTRAATRTQQPRPPRLAVIGNYLPRRCGIATFTTDLCEALAAAQPEANLFALPVNDIEAGYDYPPRVRFELAERDITSYRRAADFLNINNVDLVCLQHEFGIFGGPAGSHVLTLLGELRMPVVTTLHTILAEPDPAQRKVMDALVQLSDRLVSMSQRGVEILRTTYWVPEEKIVLIPHGVPDVPFADPSFYKDHFGVEGKTVILTFGLLSPNKGIEHVINAMPAVLARHPNTVYIVLGETHPNVKRHSGETYRLELERLARDRGVAPNVTFYNRFVSLEELGEFIGAADVYITPYLNMAQITSGTLAYTVAAGKAVISTPYLYAQELLAEGRGTLVPVADPAATANRVIDLLDNEAERHAMRKRAYLYGRGMVWSSVASQYLKAFRSVRDERRRKPRAASPALASGARPAELPALDLAHLKRLTDDAGMLQHAILAIPNYREGYSTDDNARALMLAVLLEQIGYDASEAYGFASRYLAFLWFAFNHDNRRFRNFLSYDRRWLEEAGSDDSHGRALCALGAVVGRSENDGLRALAGRLFDIALPAALQFTSPRAWAFALRGIADYLRRFAGDRAAQGVRADLAERLMQIYRAVRGDDWRWFEEILSYDNAVLPHGLVLAGHGMNRPEMVDAGLEALAWLLDVQRSEQGHFVPVGSNGFFPRGGTRARFDQQPVEAGATLSACLAAYRLTGQAKWRSEAQNLFQWFLGSNDLHLLLYDSLTGGCRDGLHPDRANQNQGAESTLSFLLALVEMQLLYGELPLQPGDGPVVR